MRRLFIVVFILLANVVQAGPLDEYAWTNRVLIVFADSDRDPRFVQQMAMLEDDPTPLENRDIVVITDLDPESELRTQLHPRGFALVLVDKDGSITLRRPSPQSVRELARMIDKTPLRIDELAAGAPR
jgi:hypothetical protein